MQPIQFGQIRYQKTSDEDHKQTLRTAMGRKDFRSFSRALSDAGPKYAIQKLENDGFDVLLSAAKQYGRVDGIKVEPVARNSSNPGEAPFYTIIIPFKRFEEHNNTPRRLLHFFFRDCLGFENDPKFPSPPRK